MCRGRQDPEGSLATRALDTLCNITGYFGERRRVEVLEVHVHCLLACSECAWPLERARPTLSLSLSFFLSRGLGENPRASSPAPVFGAVRWLGSLSLSLFLSLSRSLSLSLALGIKTPVGISARFGVFCTFHMHLAAQPCLSRERAVPRCFKAPQEQLGRARMYTASYRPNIVAATQPRWKANTFQVTAAEEAVRHAVHLHGLFMTSWSFANFARFCP